MVYSPGMTIRFYEPLFLDKGVHLDLISKGELLEFCLHYKWQGYRTPTHSSEAVQSLQAAERIRLREFRTTKQSYQTAIDLLPQVSEQTESS